jgi:cyanophycinase-like exopeptidase
VDFCAVNEGGILCVNGRDQGSGNRDQKGTLIQDSPRIPILSGIITDTHFVRRDRMGRLLVFVARTNGMPGSIPPNPVTRGIGVEEKAAVLLESDGAARVIGRGGAYFIDSPNGMGIEMPHRPLTWQPYVVQKVTPGHTFNLKT